MGIGGLTGLQTLSKVNIGRANGFKISHLKDFQHLEGRLTIKGLHKVTNAIHAKEASLHKKNGLRDLEMEWSDVFVDSRNELIEYEVLEGVGLLRSWQACLHQISIRNCPKLDVVAIDQSIDLYKKLKGCVDDLEKVQDSREGLIQNGCGNDSERVEDPGEDLIRKGCTNSVDRVEDSTAVYDCEIKEEFKSSLTERFLWSGLLDARVTLFCKKVLFACY